MNAWFVCRAKGITDDVLLPMRAGVEASDETIARKGRMIAARKFKRSHGLHPCVRVDVEFQGIENC